jgi:DNA-binding transcriptional LysR family regulator
MDRLGADRMFVAILEAGSFAAGARRRGTSAAQASKLVAALERELGVRLLHRTTRAPPAHRGRPPLPRPDARAARRVGRG